MTNKKLYRNEDEAIFAGVCTGLADYFDIDVTLMRVIFVLLFIGGGSGLLIYIILWIVTPLKKGGEAIISSKDDIKDFAEEVGKKTKNMAKEIKKEVKTSNRKGSLLGIILMAVGILILVEKIIPVEIRWDYVWPGILIFVGGYLVFRD